MRFKLANILLLAGVAAIPLLSPQTFAQDSHTNDGFTTEILDQTKFGDFAIGSKIIFARNESQRFDPWNSAYASPEYQKLLREVEASGQPRTIPVHIWYPAKPSTEKVRINERLRNPYKAVSGEQSTFSDYVLNDQNAYIPLAMSLNESVEHIKTPDGQSLASIPESGMDMVIQNFAADFIQQPRGAYIQAPVADGQFPVVILSHGLGGNYAMWDRVGEFLASHGYFVAAPTYISDGSVPLVFHDPASEFRLSQTPEQIGRAYQILSESKVVPNFLKFLFGIENPSPDFMETFDPSTVTVMAGGANKVTDMQRNLFRQRVSDLSTVKAALALLNESHEDCQLLAKGSIDKSCGEFSGKLDLSKIGLSGHSLGSMTSQLGLAHIPGITTAVGLNNGVPYSWSPQEMFGGASNADGLPVGNRKPLLQLIGNEDGFVQSIFYSIFQQAVTLAKGMPESILVLPDERAQITSENPQPVALSSYKRALSDKMIVTINDVDHGILTQHDSEFNLPNYMQDRNHSLFSYEIARNRKAEGDDLARSDFLGEPFQLLSWEQTHTGEWFYKPHVIRDYYYLNWFDCYLKGNQTAKHRLLSSPFAEIARVRFHIE